MQRMVPPGLTSSALFQHFSQRMHLSDLAMKGWRGLRFIFSKQFSVFGRFSTNFTSNDPQYFQLHGYLEAEKYSDVVYFHTAPLVIVDGTK